MTPLIPEGELTLIEAKLLYTFQNKYLLEQAFIHCSFVNEQKHNFQNSSDFHNERLEFLGDSVLGLIIASHLYRSLPHVAEGPLSHLRSRLVDSIACHGFAHKLQIESHLRLGRGEKNNGTRGRTTILSDLFEALMGAIYLDGGLAKAELFFLSHFDCDLKAIMERPERNWKAELQDYSQKTTQKTPVYTVLNESGPDHNKTFEISVSIDGKEWGRAAGASKKEAQQNAAKEAVQQLNLQGL